MSIKAKIEIDNSELKKGLKDAENQASRSMQNVQKAVGGVSSTFSKLASSAGNASQAVTNGIQGISSLLTKLGPVGVAAAAGITAIGAAAAGVFTVIGKITNKLDEISKSAKSVNMSANAYISLQHACSRAGVEMDSMITLIGKIDYALTRASDGEKKFRDAFYALGLSWRDMAGYSPEKKVAALTDAWRKFNDEGKKLPPEVYDVFGRKDIQTLNKASKEKFGKLIAEAGALGYNIDPEMLKAAEAYTDATSDANQQLQAMVSNLEITEELTKKLTKWWVTVGKEMSKGNGTGFVPEAYRDTNIGIADVGVDLIKNKKLSDDVLRDLVYQNRMDKIEGLSGDDPLGYAMLAKKHSKEVAKMSAYELQKELESINFRIMGQNLKRSLFKAVEGIDNRFKANDPEKWVAELTDEERSENINKLAKDRAQDEVDDINKELQKSSKYYDDILNKIGIEYDVEKKILDLEKKLSIATKGKVTKLEDAAKESLRYNANLMKEKALEAEIKTLRDRGKASNESFFTNIFSNAGANRNMLQQLQDFEKKFNREENPWDTRFENVFRDAYSERYNSKDYMYVDPIDVMKNDPKKFYQSIKQAASELNDLQRPLNFDDDFKKLYKNIETEYNKVAKKLKVNPLEINLEGDATDPDFWKRLAEESVDNIKQFENAIKNLEARLAKMNETPGDSLRKAQIGKQINEYKQLLYNMKFFTNSFKDNEGFALLNKNSAEAQKQRMMEISFAMMKQAEDANYELRIIQAQARGQEQIVKQLQLQNELRKAGLPLTKENLEMIGKSVEIMNRYKGRSQYCKTSKGSSRQIKRDWHQYS